MGSTWEKTLEIALWPADAGTHTCKRAYPRSSSRWTPHTRGYRVTLWRRPTDVLIWLMMFLYTCTICLYWRMGRLLINSLLGCFEYQEADDTGLGFCMGITLSSSGTLRGSCLFQCHPVTACPSPAWEPSIYSHSPATLWLWTPLKIPMECCIYIMLYLVPEKGKIVSVLLNSQAVRKLDKWCQFIMGV